MESEKIEIITTEFQKAILSLIENLEIEQFPDAEEYKLALKYDSLPIGLDLFSYVFLNSNGEVIWDDTEGDVGSSNDLQSLIRVLSPEKDVIRNLLNLFRIVSMNQRLVLFVTDLEYGNSQKTYEPANRENVSFVQD
jgi:hypothetical protein